MVHPKGKILLLRYLHSSHTAVVMPSEASKRAILTNLATQAKRVKWLDTIYIWLSDFQSVCQ